MKKLENRLTSLDNGNGGKMGYFDLFKLSLENKTNDGFTVQEMRKRLKALDKLEEKEKTEMEDAEFETLRACWGDMKWGIISKDISEADTYLQSLAT